MNYSNFDVAIVGGGLAGLVLAIELKRRGLNVALFEKKSYPFHKVCGEYLSKEVKPYLEYLGLEISNRCFPEITKLEVTGPSGNSRLSAVLPLGGVGISRFLLDSMLYKLATNEGATVFTDTKVASISFEDGIFKIESNKGNFVSGLCIGSYGKRDLLDKNLGRDFIKNRSPYMAVKYHISTEYPPETIGIYNFKGGYCGISPIEDGKFCLCYISHRANMDGLKGIAELEEKTLFKNKALKHIFENSHFHFKQPKVINEISFARKPLVEKGIIMCGDSAGMISPICGNGMAMAIHSAKILGRIIGENIRHGSRILPANRQDIEINYKREWNLQFKNRMKWGMGLQYLAGNTFLSEPFIKVTNAVPIFKNWLIRQTHGGEILQG